MSQPIQLNSFQQRLLNEPEEHDLFAGGGRGGGKSYALALLARSEEHTSELQSR